jgi:hypothetical protein
VRKRASKRRWKARCRAGRVIPFSAIVEHSLDCWFSFKLVNVAADMWRAQP